MLPILEPFFMLFMLIALGSVLHHFKIMDLSFSKKLSGVVVKVTFPALLFTSMYQNIDLTTLRRGLVFSLVGLGISLILAVTAHLSAGRLGLERKSYGTYQILCTNGNNIFLPVPIISSLYGPVYVVYAFLFELGAGLFYWSCGISHFRAGPRFSLKRALNQNMLALILGLSAGVLNIVLPGTVVGALELLGSITIGAAMLIIGSLVADALKKRPPWRSELYGVLAHRTVLSPLLAFVFLKLFPFPDELGPILLLLSAMPPLATTALVAASFDADETLATLGVVIPTLLSFVILPLFLYLGG